MDRKLDIWFGEAAETGRPPRRSKLAAEAVTAAAVETSEKDTPNGVLVDASQISESSSDSGSGGDLSRGSGAGTSGAAAKVAIACNRETI